MFGPQPRWSDHKTMSYHLLSCIFETQVQFLAMLDCCEALSLSRPQPPHVNRKVGVDASLPFQLVGSQLLDL